jgi:hypothetical protein
MAAMTALVEYYYGESNAPHEALGRAARRLSQGGALYLGGGIGIEKQVTKSGDRFNLTRADATGKPESFTGPLSAVMRGFAVAGGSTATDTPGGATKVTDPAAAARLRELNDAQRETEKDIERYQSRLAAKVPDQTTVGSIVAPTEKDPWEARRLAELKRELKQIEDERTTLLSTGKVEEAEVGKPGTNWTQVTPAARKKVDPLVKHWMGKAHPWQACVDELTPEKGAEAAKKICSVVKDMGMKTTKWRAGGKKKLKEEQDAVIVTAMQEACGRIATIEASFGAGAAVELAERAGSFGDALLDTLGESAFDDLSTLFVCGHPLGELWQEVREGFAENLHPRDFLGKWKTKVGGLKVGEKAAIGDGVSVHRTAVKGYEVHGPARVGDLATSAAHKAQLERNGTPITRLGQLFPTPDRAAILSAQKSASLDHPMSVGGRTKYPSLNAALKSGEGKGEPNLAVRSKQREAEANNRQHTTIRGLAGKLDSQSQGGKSGAAETAVALTHALTTYKRNGGKETEHTRRAQTILDRHRAKKPKVREAAPAGGLLGDLLESRR